MTIIDKPNKFEADLNSKVSSIESFEQVYKTAYTHGLEAIYSLETVDLKTVRKIEQTPSKTEFIQNEVRSAEPAGEFVDWQHEFDFGDGFRDWVEPYYLQEPIQGLGLSFQAEACLNEHGLKRVSDLLAHNFRDYVFLKGMGQGHIDEVQKKLKVFIGGRSVKKARIIDFKSLVLSLSVGINFKKLSLFLEDYGLAHCVPLTSSEKVELKAFGLSKDEGWRSEVLDLFDVESRKSEAVESLRKIMQAFVLPWMLNRQGVATQEEIVERLERVSLQPEETHLYLNFFSKNFTEGKFPFSSHLPQTEREVYCTDKGVAAAFRDIIEVALSYFYKPEISYSFRELINLLGREFAKDWKEYTEEFMSACLKRSSSFRTLREPSGKLMIVLA